MCSTRLFSSRLSLYGRLRAPSNCSCFCLGGGSSSSPSDPLPPRRPSLLYYSTRPALLKRAVSRVPSPWPAPRSVFEPQLSRNRRLIGRRTRRSKVVSADTAGWPPRPRVRSPVVPLSFIYFPISFSARIWAPIGVTPRAGARFSSAANHPRIIIYMESPGLEAPSLPLARSPRPAPPIYPLHPPPRRRRAPPPPAHLPCLTSRRPQTRRPRPPNPVSAVDALRARPPARDSPQP